ncbi:Two-component hybrid sensor and regulator [Minicystis rosea]|nr:Two-component hybrid sensor and regulator [Minicystis rosea]
MRWDDIDFDGRRTTGRLGFWETDLRSGVVQWTSDVDDIFGRRPWAAAPTIEGLLEPIAPDDRERVETDLRRSIVHRFEHFRAEYRCLRGDGSEIVVRNEWSVECDPANMPVMVRGVIQDVTYRRQTKAVLHRQTALMGLLYDVAKCANEARTLDQALATTVERICQFGGWPVGHVYAVSDTEPRELVPTKVWYAADPERFEALRRARKTARRTLDHAGPRWSPVIAERAPLPVATAAAMAGLRAALHLPVVVGEETVAAIECFAYEERAPNPDMLEAMAHVAAQLGRVFERSKIARLKDEFVSTVSHELRTPLTSILGAMKLLESGVLGPLPAEAQEMVRIAGEGCRRLHRLVDELLDVQKLESDKMSLRRELTLVAPILEEVVKVSGPHAAEQGVSLTLVDEAAGAVALADRDRLAQVVANLLSNAIRHSPPGATVVTRITRRDGWVCVSVEDRGPGVPAEFLSRLFQKFSQADASDARRKTGTGLGLAICKTIIENLGGTIGYDPRPDGGAIFHFELPERERTSSPETP